MTYYYILVEKKMIHVSLDRPSPILVSAILLQDLFLFGTKYPKGTVEENYKRSQWCEYHFSRSDLRLYYTWRQMVFCNNFPSPLVWLCPSAPPVSACMKAVDMEKIWWLQCTDAMLLPCLFDLDRQCNLIEHCNIFILTRIILGFTLWKC